MIGYLSWGRPRSGPLKVDTFKYNISPNSTSSAMNDELHTLSSLVGHNLHILEQFNAVLPRSQWIRLGMSGEVLDFVYLVFF